MYKTPEVGTEFPAKENTSVKNPGPQQDPEKMNPWLQAQAQNDAYEKNLILVEEYTNAKKDSPSYAKQLGSNHSYGVKVLAAEIGGIYFDVIKIGPLVEQL